MSYQQAYQDIMRLIRDGREAMTKVASFHVPGVFLYWDPNSDWYVCRTPLANSIQKRAEARVALCRCGVMPHFAESEEETEYMVPLKWPDGYSPLRSLNKYAAIDTPAKSMVAGALVGGGLGALGGGALGFIQGIDQPLTLGQRLRNVMYMARKGIIPGAAIGSFAGPVRGTIRSLNTMYEDENGRIKWDVSPLDTVLMTEDDIAKKSPMFALQRKLDDDLRDVYLPPSKRTKEGFYTGPNPPSHLIHVDNFNRTVWNDANNGVTKPENALLVTSTLSASRPHGGQFVTPGAVMGTLVNAGVGYATAGVIGKALGAMGVISTASQQKLQQMGAWGGMINGIGNMMRR